MTAPLAKNSQHFQGILLMILSSLLWPSMLVAIHEVISTVSPFVQIAIRFTIGAVVFAPFARNLNRNLIRDGAILGVLMFAAFVTQTVALESIPANQASFTVGLVIILITLFEVVFYRRLSLVAILAAALAFTGIGIMSWQDGPPAIGAVWMLICASLIAAIVILLERIAPRHPVLPLIVVEIWAIAILSCLLAAPEMAGQIEVITASLTQPKNIVALLYLGIVGTGAVTWLQAKALSRITAFEGGLIQTMEPVVGSIYAFFLLGETFRMSGYAGAVLVIAGMIVALSERKAAPISAPPQERERGA
ncbi:DMT family transporter [Kamptonema formosum]|uniref:DMT family transporter n=1 Tax=Kamptonema formosum TaxID=331992 RepID=UPI0009E64436|nr:DMT family transporter [Oscillatoria sp. PCC 10802]